MGFIVKKLRMAFKSQGDQGPYRREGGAMLPLKKLAFGKTLGMRIECKQEIEENGGESRYAFRLLDPMFDDVMPFTLLFNWLRPPVDWPPEINTAIDARVAAAVPVGGARKQKKKKKTMLKLRDDGIDLKDSAHASVKTESGIKKADV